jgi:hypothetical protein
MKNFMMVVVVAGVALTGFSTAQAMPLAPLNQDQSGSIIRVYGGCGYGGHSGPYGGCRPLYNCPPGWRSGPYGRRYFRNW